MIRIGLALASSFDCVRINMDIEDRNLIGIEYPGRVENVDNMIKTIGGLTNFSKVVRFYFATILMQKPYLNCILMI